MNRNVTAFFRGFASIANISGRGWKMRAEFTRNDSEAMRKDFDEVGEDLRVAVREVSGDVPRQLRFSFK